MFEHLKSAIQRSSQRARNRRDYRALLALDDHYLQDIGVTRDDLRCMYTGR